MSLWTAAEALAATGGGGVANWEATGVSIDTRTLQPGDLFVALAAQRDGHDFVAQALEKGAAAALVTHLPEGVDPHAPLIFVPDVLEGLARLAQAARARMSGKVVAVTGSVGKTGTKEMLRTALSGQGATHAAEKSYNNHWGVPLTLARMPRETDYAVIEIGMNAPGEIAPLAKLARPHVAVVTTVAAVHLEAFENVEGIAREKATIIEGLEPDGIAVLNGEIGTSDILVSAAQAGGARVVRFGSGNYEASLRSVVVKGLVTCAEADLNGQPVVFKLAAPGAHLATNALAVLAAVEALGADLALASLALAHWAPPEGRGARWRVALGPGGIDGHVTLIDESYNANPLAMGAAFEVFVGAQPVDGVGKVRRGRRIAFLGDMLELGPEGPQMHASLAEHPAMAQIDTVHCAGPLMKRLYEALPEAKRGECCKTTKALAKKVPRLIDAGDVVMAKGSLGSDLAVVVDAIKKLGDATDMRQTGESD
ncbi:UDP-N-acetylmuramoyl-tripeptide--D-alanyl-D-alanine ligase [Algicella marina]|uniref:UDP-N-acetylmuramoyl-tripeptide--D-alanyl-D-alanine ligase n=1 Tax=Algicella marina TaxID=2683284 RepID=A0A6P1STN3_9RHOB|nr:UDP-N-acetylmuramoyl-tripeptide--D-alanyl-D-alanine ligase [Algicella marina]QHQ34044.1 UDP-N-acetylmuramoyl-tripeptide--D-alanyl-D-alanine ligase [Algicella marina]